MRSRTFAVIILSFLITIITWIFTPNAWALVQIKLFDLTYHDCPAEVAAGTVTSNGTTRAANCFIITGKTENNSGKPVVNADIFGRIYDAYGNSVMENRTRLGSIDEIPIGVGNFDLRISVPANQPTPLQLQQFKAAGFTGTVRR